MTPSGALVSLKRRAAAAGRLAGLGWTGAALAVHLGLGSLILAHDGWRVLRPDPDDVAARARASGLPAFAAALAATVPPDDTVLYATPSADPLFLWSYFTLSSELYPRTVWWTTPERRRSPVSWWRAEPFDRRTLSELGPGMGARVLVLDWTGSPPPDRSPRPAAPPPLPGAGERALVWIER